MRTNLLKYVLVFVFTAAVMAVLSTTARAEAANAAQNATRITYFPLQQPAASGDTALSIPSLNQFAALVENGQADVVRGAYVQNKLALNVVQQPANDAGYVSTDPANTTQFKTAASYDVIGLLAHNFIAGSLFYDLAAGDMVSIIYGDGTVKQYRIDAIQSYQALSPDDPHTDFIDLETGAPLNAYDLFARVYTGEHHVTFQTCIERDGNGSWGRLFVTATPIAKK
jgi:hypothetical protein